jgi:hypothetical protein
MGSSCRKSRISTKRRFLSQVGSELNLEFPMSIVSQANRTWARAGVLTALCAAMAAPALADTASDRIEQLEKKLEKSLKLIDTLAARLAEVERTKPAATAAAQPPAATAASAEVARLQEAVTQMSESLSKRSGDTGLPVHGFADVGGAWSGGDDPQKLRGFNGGTLDLYLTPQFGERVKTLIELVTEYHPDGTMGTDAERLQIGYTLSDAVMLWAGRFHTPYGLWNTSFHHGANLQTSIYRPRFLDFEDKGGITSAHTVGLWATGKTTVGDGKLTYDGYVGNGSSIRARVLDFNGFTDDTSDKAVGFNLGYIPRGALSGWTVGVHGLTSNVNVLDTANAVLSETRVRMLGAYAGYDADDWEVVSEYYGFRNSESGGSSYNSTAWFAQVGKTFGLWTPFVRYEHVGLDAGDRYFSSQEYGRSYKRTSAGLRYALDPRASLKFELSTTTEKATSLIDETGAPAAFGGGSYRRGSFQYSIAF